MDVQDFIVNRDQHMRPLEYDLSENFNELVRYLKDVGVLDNVPVGVTAESEIASVSDAYPAPPRALNVYGKSTQAGTPTPDAPVPILSVDDLALAVAGKNILDEANNIVRGFFYDQTTNIGGGGTSIYAPVLEGATYTLSGGNGNRYSVGFTDVMPAVNVPLVAHASNNHTFTVPSGAKYVVFYIDSASDKTPSGYQLEAGSTASAYTPYVEMTTVPDLLPEGTSLRSLPDGTKDQLSLSYLRPSTREGWAWYSRELVQAVQYADMGDIAWTYSDTYTYFSANLSDAAPAVNEEVSTICENYICDANSTINSIRNYMSDKHIRMRNAYAQVFVKDSTYTTIEAFTTAVTGVELLYPLATPVTTQLDPIELPTLPAPTATVWCDGGSATPTLVLEYVRDTNATIADLSEAIADIVSG